MHANAIIDMSFSDDDSLLATAAGDQSCRITDMSTQQTVAILGYHTSSLKQARFQPGVSNNNILATSSRDGTVQIWDLRCKGDVGPANALYMPVNQEGRVSTRSALDRILYGRPVNSIHYAHQTWKQPLQGISSPANANQEAINRTGDISITSIQWLPYGKEHLILTACEADACMRLWDARYLHRNQKALQTPLSITKAPQTHDKWRHFGVNSINMSGDGSRIYTLCKDNTVYAYSTAHLIMGHAPELEDSTQSRPGPQRGVQQGLGPLHGYRHPMLQASSFYVKSAIRPAKDGKCEMLAVGSSNGCAILFPTDERHLPKLKLKDPDEEETNPNPFVSPSKLPSLRTRIGGRAPDNIPISTKGTPLIRGHDREIGSVAWSSEGNLITVGDDFLVRCWREGGSGYPNVARELRMGGEAEGKRWQCGWAEVSKDYDDDDSD